MNTAELRFAPGPEFEWRSHLVCGRFAFKVLVKRSALSKQRRVTDRAAGIGGRPSAAGRAIACNVCELAPFLGRAKRRDTGRAGGLRLSQLTLEGGVLTLDVGEPGLECGEAVLDGRPRARRRDHSQRNEAAGHRNEQVVRIQTLSRRQRRKKSGQMRQEYIYYTRGADRK